MRSRPCTQAYLHGFIQLCLDARVVSEDDGDLAVRVGVLRRRGAKAETGRIERPYLALAIECHGCHAIEHKQRANVLVLLRGSVGAASEALLR